MYLYGYGFHAFSRVERLCLEANLAGMGGFPNLDAVSIEPDGTVDPFSQLFRATFVGVEMGPFISQVW